MRELKLVCQELSKPENQIRAPSGLEKPHEKIQHIVHAQQSRADKEKQIASQLVHLQKFTAWVKIAENISQNPGKKCLNCGLLNKYGDEYCTTVEHSFLLRMNTLLRLFNRRKAYNNSTNVKSGYKHTIFVMDM